MNDFEALIMGIFTNEAMVPALSPADRTTIVAYYTTELSKNNITPEFMRELLAALNIKAYPFSMLKRSLFVGPVVKSLSNAVDRLEIQPENVAFLEMLFSLEFFKSTRMDAVRQRVLMLKKAVKDE